VRQVPLVHIRFERARIPLRAAAENVSLLYSSIHSYRQGHGYDALTSNDIESRSLDSLTVLTLHSRRLDYGSKIAAAQLRPATDREENRVPPECVLLRTGLQ